MTAAWPWAGSRPTSLTGAAAPLGLQPPAHRPRMIGKEGVRPSDDRQAAAGACCAFSANGSEVYRYPSPVIRVRTVPRVSRSADPDHPPGRQAPPRSCLSEGDLPAVQYHEHLAAGWVAVLCVATEALHGPVSRRSERMRALPGAADLPVVPATSNNRRMP